MKIGYLFGGHKHEITTEHSASSYGAPILLVSGKVVSEVFYEADEIHHPSILDQLARQAGVWPGPATLSALQDLANEMLADVENPRGADYDRVVDEFIRRGAKMRGEETVDDLLDRAREDGVPIPEKEIGISAAAERLRNLRRGREA